MSNVLVIGNGFDIYHGLPTRYTDFLFLVKNWGDFYNSFKESEGNEDDIEFIDVRLSEKGELCLESLEDYVKHKHIFNAENIEYLNNHITNNYWNQYFLNYPLKGRQWVDFESEINDVLHAVEFFFEHIFEHAKTGRILATSEIINSDIGAKMKLFLNLTNDKYNYNYRGVIPIHQVEESRLKGHKLYLIDKLKEELDVLIECLRLYFLEFVEPIKCDTYSEQIKTLGEVKLLTFNYTNTYNRIYPDLQNECHFIHGNCLDNEIVLGIPDDSFIDQLEYIYFVKYFQRIQKRTGDLYKKWNRKISLTRQGRVVEKAPVTLYIMGHSLAETDKGVLGDFFYSNGVKNIIIFYHSQEAYENIVINLVRMFGKDFVISQTGSGRISFEKLKPAKKKN